MLALSSHEWDATDYDSFATALREIDKREDVLVTVWQGLFVCAIGGLETTRLPFFWPNQPLGNGSARESPNNTRSYNS